MLVHYNHVYTSPTAKEALVVRLMS